MRSRGIRRLVVVESEKLVVVVTMNDLARNMTGAVEDFAATLHLMGRKLVQSYPLL